MEHYFPSYVFNKGCSLVSLPLSLVATSKCRFVWYPRWVTVLFWWCFLVTNLIFLAYKLFWLTNYSRWTRTALIWPILDLNGRAETLLGIFERRYLHEIGISSRDDDRNSSNDDGLSSSPTTTSWWDWNAISNNYRPQQVATKLAPYPWRITPGSIVKSAEGSLLRLKQEKLAVAQLHWSTANYFPFQERALWEGICDVYDKGLCDAVGVSNYGPKQLFAVSERLREREGKK